MKTTKEVLDFCNDFTFYDHYNIDRPKKLNHDRDYINNVLSEKDFKHADDRIKMMGFIEINR